MAEKRPLESYFEGVVEETGFENFDMKFELLRLGTFVNWPGSCPVQAIRLAAAGFYFTSDNDKVLCFICKQGKNHWKAGDIPLTIHRRLSPQCPFILNENKENFSPVLPENWKLSDKFNRIKHLFSTHGTSNPNTGSMAVGGLAAAGGSDEQNEPLSGKSESSDSGSFSDRIHAERSLPEVQPKNEPDNTSNTLPRLPAQTGVSDQLRLSLSSGSLSSSGSDSSTMVKESVASGGSSQTALASSAQNRTQSDRENKTLPPMKSGGKSQNQPVSGLAIGGSDIGSRGQFDNLGTLSASVRDGGPLKIERNRLESFRNWPANANVNPQDLAKSGFFYTGQGDRVQCVFCRGILRNWDPGDIPHIEHRNKYARCPFMLGMSVGNVPMSANQSPHQSTTVNRGAHFLNQGPSSMESLGISTERPKHPNYAIEGNRITTFNNSNWPAYKHQTPKLLAQAGFFYAGFGDNVKCFFCDGGLKNWEPGDNPWEEHTRWYPSCPFVKSVKGEQYILSVQSKYNIATGQVLASSVNSATQPRAHAIEEREIKARLETPLVITVLNTGVSRQAVIVAIERRLRETGNDFPNAQALMDKVLELEESGDLSRTEPVVQQNENSTADQNEQIDLSTSSGQDSISSNNVNSQSEQSVTRSRDITGPSSGTGSGPSSGTGSGPSSGAVAGPASGMVVGAVTGPSSAQSGELEKENRILKEQKTCKICLDEEVGVVFLPCGHLCCCVNCAPAVNLCPICRTGIKGSVRTYIP